MAESYVTNLEEVVAQVADWASSLVQDIADELSPTGRPFGLAELTDEQKIEAYTRLRGDPAAWRQYLLDQTDAVMQTLIGQGLNPDAIASVHPYNIAAMNALAWSVEMEELLSSRMGV